jgi:formamidopyrimidine-DNA glycosylase
MPELPEVETIKNGLAELLPSRQIIKVDYDWPKSFPNSTNDVQQFLIGAKVSNIWRRAKVLIIDLSTKYSLVIHLKMTGQLIFVGKNQRFAAGHPSESLIGELPDKSTRVVVKFADSSQLYFNDQRKFGWMRLIPSSEVMSLDFFKKIGPEPLAQDFTWQLFHERIMRRPNSVIKAVLLDQSTIAGVGNIYADESLWGAKINPGTRVNKLSTNKIKLLHKELIAVLKLSIAKGGSSDRNYIDAHGNKGSYLSFAHVFRRDGLPCPRCGTSIIKNRTAGRGTHFCPHCQPLVT